MAIVIDAARGVGSFSDYNTTYQKGNDNANTPTPTWLEMHTTIQSVAETHVNFAYEAPTNNTADTWVPMYTTTFLSSTPNTVR